MRDIAVGVCDCRRVRGVVLVSRVRPRGRCRGSWRVRGVVVVVGRGHMRAWRLESRIGGWYRQCLGFRGVMLVASVSLGVTFDRRLLGP